MLGISATVDRKDGLTQVLHMFIGDKIYSEERENDDPVCVRAIEYKTADPVFNEVEYDYRGNPKYSTMVSKLCAYNRRTDFVVRIIRDLVEENPENQIMVLAHQRSILTYLYDAIRHRAIAEVGFYVGGMKQGDLADTETKQIVLATYAMAAEALDIKSLSTLVMITPKTDIVQSVGRILRTKHDSPIIVDIVDQHDLFQKQWFQRRRFYKKCQYRIRQIDSDRYAGMTLDWEKDQTWRRVFEPAPGADSSSSDEEAEPSLASRRCLIDWSEM
jgi:superfamily II DNA or RNA helicase